LTVDVIVYISSNQMHLQYIEPITLFIVCVPWYGTDSHNKCV